MRNICSKCGVGFFFDTKRSVCLDCVPFDLPVSKEQLVGEYEAGVSQRDLIRKYSLCKRVVTAVIHNYGSARPSSPFKHPVGQFPIINLNLDWLDGWLLGDGSLKRPCKGNAYCRHSSSRVGYVRYILEKWRLQGISSNQRIYKSERLGKVGGVTYCVNSHVHPDLTEQFNRWYPSGRKRVPENVSFSPESLLEWYLGDGTFNQKDGIPSYILGNVSEEEVGLLLNGMIPKFGDVRSGEYERSELTGGGVARLPQYRLRFTKESSVSFFSYIGICPLQCYSYKWPATLNKKVISVPAGSTV